MSQWITMHSKFGGTCIECHGQIEEGGQIQWCKGIGAKHRECPEQPVIESCYVENPIDPETHSYEELRKIEHCQDCGQKLDKIRGVFIDCDRRVCDKHFGSNQN